jgi:hypothetical protein
VGVEEGGERKKERKGGEGRKEGERKEATVWPFITPALRNCLIPSSKLGSVSVKPYNMNFKINLAWVLVAHTYDPSYSGGRRTAV